MTPSRLTLSLAAALAAVALSACSGASEEPDSDAATASDSPTAPSSATPGDTTSPTPSETAPEGPLLEVVIAGDKVSPNAVELRVGVGETLRLTIDSDRAGELHVHSKPEQYVQFAGGASKHELVITTPGEVEVEDHDTGAVVALIEVR